MLVIAEVNAFHVMGVVFGIWAVLVAILGFRRANFPAGDGAMRAVIAITTLLMAGTLAAAILTAEKHEPHGSTHGDRENPSEGEHAPENKPDE
ncbi:MAG: hypothetical protein M3340_14715 [Actinomycetota bacterium]|nr:hypothetical protein [Actinomycetota bacterium]